MCPIHGESSTLSERSWTARSGSAGHRSPHSYLSWPRPLPRRFLKPLSGTLNGQRQPRRNCLSKSETLSSHRNYIWDSSGHSKCWPGTAGPCRRVSLILATLDEKTPAGRSGNSPSRSLLEIFMPWLPQTTAPVEERVKVLRNLAEKRPNATWRLLVGLLPNQQELLTPIRRPLWRDWALDWSARVLRTELSHQVGAFAHLLVEQTGKDVERWKALVEHVEDLPGPVQKEFLDRLNGFAESALDEQIRRGVSDALREKVSMHRKFAGARWALHDETLAVLERLQSRFEPEDPVRKNAWLFELRRQGREMLYGQEERLAESRRSAVRAILGKGGWEGVLELVEAVEAPGDVGAAFAAIGSDECQTRILPTLLRSTNEQTTQFVAGYISGCFSSRGWDWVNRLNMHDWSAKEVGRFLVVLPFERRTWEFAARKGDEVAEWYWSNPPFFRRGEDVDEAIYAIEMLLQHKRPLAAFQVLRDGSPPQGRP